MSGYFGVVRLDGGTIDEKLLQRTADRLSFRGSDGTSVWSNDRVGGCCTLMRTNSAPQSDRQPVVIGQRFLLWGDVRLDGQAELREQLGADAAPSSLETNEQLLLRSWDRWGAGALERIIGDFSFALWDAQEACLTCARDFVGARPLYYTHLGGAFYFGNTLNVFLDVPEISRELDELFVADFLTAGYSLDTDRSVFRDVKRLPAGHTLRFAKNGIAIRRFRRLPVEEPFAFREEREYIDGYLKVLDAAVRDRFPQGPTALYLSGGLDSGSVCAMAAEIARERGRLDRLKAYTLGWQPFFDDPEPKFASLSAAHLRITHEVLTDSELIPFLGADSPKWLVPEPDQEYFFLREKKRFEQISKHARVVLGGDGGDDVLAGQSWPYLVQLWRRRDWKKLAGDFGGYLWTHQQFPPLRFGLRAKIREFLRRGDEFEGYPRWLNSDFEAKLNLMERWRQLDRPIETGHPLHPQAYRALHEGCWAGVLETEDAGWNGVQLEARVPLLDLRVLRFMLRLPPVPWCVKKELSRRAMKAKLPEAVLRRPKTPLQQDPLEHCSLHPEWPQSLAKEGRARVERFVNWNKWCETLSESEGSLSWRSLRPISLLFWLKAVENRMGIK